MCVSVCLRWIITLAAWTYDIWEEAEQLYVEIDWLKVWTPVAAVDLARVLEAQKTEESEPPRVVIAELRSAVKHCNFAAERTG